MNIVRSFACLVLLGLLLGGLSLSAHAQDAPADAPGYVNPAIIEGWFDARPNVEINLTGALLGMVAAATDDSEPELSGLLRRIEGIYVRVYTDSLLTRPTDLRNIDALADRLSSQGWQTVVRVRDGEDNVNIQLKTRDDDAILGLFVMANDSDGERVFVNIVGDIRPEEITRIGQAFDIDPLKDVPVSDDNNDDTPD